MNRKSKIAIAATALLAGGIALAGVATAHMDNGKVRSNDDGWSHGSMMGPGQYGGMMGGGMMGGGMMGQGMKGRAMSMMRAFDANSDGKLTQAEIDAARDARLAKYDANGDGALDLSEYQALWLDAMREKMVDRFQYLDANGDGTVTASEFRAPYAALVQRMDHNDDVALSRDDMRRGQSDNDSDD